MTTIAIICILGFIILILNIKTVQKNSYIPIRVICTLLFILSMMRYITLLLFASGRSIPLLQKLQCFYFGTSIGITIPFVLALWYITPIYRQKIHMKGLLLLCAPWAACYSFFCIVKPFNIIKAPTTGYMLKLMGDWHIYLSILQGIFVTCFISAAIYGYKCYKHKRVRSQYLVMIICQLLFLLDGLSYFGLGQGTIPPFTLTEVLGFLGIYYGFVKPPIDARGIQK